MIYQKLLQVVKLFSSFNLESLPPKTPLCEWRSGYIKNNLSYEFYYLDGIIYLDAEFYI